MWGTFTDENSLTSDWDNQWLTGGLEADVIAEAHLDPESVLRRRCPFCEGPAEAHGSAARFAEGLGINTETQRHGGTKKAGIK